MHVSWFRKQALAYAIDLRDADMLEGNVDPHDLMEYVSGDQEWFNFLESKLIEDEVPIFYGYYMGQETPTGKPWRIGIEVEGDDEFDSYILMFFATESQAKNWISDRGLPMKLQILFKAEGGIVEDQ